MRRLFAFLCFCVAFSGVILAQDKPDVPALVKQLKDKDAFVRLKAAKTLGQLGPAAKDAVPALKEALADDDEDVRTFAKRALDAIGDPRIADPKTADLMKNLRDKNAKVRLEALASLGKIGTGAKAADGAIIDSMLVLYPKNRDEHLEALEKVHPELSKHVVTLLVDKDKRDALDAVGKMAEKGRAALPILISFCEADTKTGYEQLQLHAQAIWAAGRIAPDDPRTIKLYTRTIAFLPAKDEFVATKEAYLREQSLKNMKGVKIPAATLVPALVSAMTDRNDPLAKGNALTAIGMLGELGPGAKSALPALNRLKLDQDAKVREAVTDALGKINK